MEQTDNIKQINRGKLNISTPMKYILLIVLAVITAASVALVNYPDVENVNYTNSDATWHTLLTMQCYDENPASTHKFLPIVTLNGDINKWVTWGATIPDAQGNYYYTSFSPAGYVLPYFFVKIFGLPINETSLYIFNSLLLAATAALIGLIIRRLFADKRFPFLLGAIGAVIYCFIPEVMNSQGIVYWHQSVMQVALAIQLLSFISIAKGSAGRGSYITFFLMCLMNPYIEWTGYVANIGYAIGFFIIYRKNSDTAFKNGGAVLGLTAASFMLFALHYMSVVSVDDLSKALETRFFARSASSHSVSYIDLLKGYIDSFQNIFILIAALLILTLLVYRNLSFIKKSAFFSNKTVFLVAFFPVLENILMKNHAVNYTYDRMKLSFILIFIVCDLMYLIIDRVRGLNLYALPSAAALVLAAAVCAVNIISFPGAREWSIDYRANNRLLADYCTAKYTEKNSVYGLDTYTVRGYINLLFGRSVYEWSSEENDIKNARARNMRYAVTIYIERYGQWNLYELSYIAVNDLKSNTRQIISVKNGAIDVYRQ